MKLSLAWAVSIVIMPDEMKALTLLRTLTSIGLRALPG